jgi:DNA uptake protein ComE-like DNA-binding protein
MTLGDATALAAVTTWRAFAEPQWSDAENQRLSDALVALSDEVTPHVVADAALTAAEEQEFLLGRAVGELHDWLSRAAAPIRSSLRLEAPRLNEAGDAPALGLRSATLEELEDLPAVGEARARDIARLVALNPRVRKVADLEAIDGVGPQTVATVGRHAYLDRPVVGLVSPSLLAFAERPGMDTFVGLLSATDLEITFGDGNTLARRGPGGGSAAERVLSLLDLVREVMSRAKGPASGVLASEARRWLGRRALRQQVLNGLAPATGTLLINEAYVEAARTLIAGAENEISLMVFLGTAAASNELGPGPLQLVEALEERADAGVSTRVILDQDDGGEPYKSLFINRGLVDRFAAGNVEVKFDEEDVLLHSKVLVVDGTAAIVGSHNWTRSGFSNTHEVSVLLHGAAHGAAFAARFQAFWDALP